MGLVDIVSLAAFILAITGNLLINAKRRSGFMVWIVANSLWVAVNLLGETNWFQVAMFASYSIFNVFGYFGWSKSKTVKDSTTAKRV